MPPESRVFEPAQLRSFLAVAETLSFTKAAERLGLAQPTVSQHVRKLEAAAKRVLVSRDTRDVLNARLGARDYGDLSSL